MTESVAGLNLNAPVRYRGVDVGRVRKIALAPGNVEQVQLTLDIERGTPVKEDTVATLQTQGLTGIAFVELTAGHRDSPRAAREPGRAVPGHRVGAVADEPPRDGDARAAREPQPRERQPQRAARRREPARGEGDARRPRAPVAHACRALGAIDATLASTARTMERPPAHRHGAAVAAALPQLVQRVERSADAFDRMATEVAGAGDERPQHARRRARRPGAVHRDDAARSARAGRRAARADGDAAPRRRRRSSAIRRAPPGAAAAKTRTRRMIDDA